MNEKPLQGKRAIVTGGNRGIGRAIALAVANAGADVHIGARDEATMQSTVAEIRAAGVDASWSRVDVTRSAEIDAFVRSVSDSGNVDILVNNSGVVSSLPLLDADEDEFDRVFDTNVRSCYLMTRAVGAIMRERGGGKIVNIASNFAFKGVANHSLYSASKAAIVSLTRSLAVEWARHGIQVNALAPGYFATDLNADARADADLLNRIVRTIPTRRMGAPDELGPWVVMLASEAGDYLTGETIVIDGGLNAR